MRDRNVEMFNETIDICKKGFYVINGKRVDLKLSKDDMEVSIALSPETVQSKIDAEILNCSTHPFVMGRTYVGVENTDSFEVAKEIIPSYDVGKVSTRKVLVLNFANPVTPGGGVVRGARAQEEDLCRKSSLYISLTSGEAKDMYAYNKKLNDYLASDYMVLSPNVEIIRDRDGNLATDTTIVGVLTAAAPMVSHGRVRASSEEIAEIIRHRIKGILHIAAYYGYEYLVLGAWGCGAFGNDAAVVAKLFYEEMKKFKVRLEGNQDMSYRLKDFFRRIIFGVLDKSEDKYNFNSFNFYFDNFYAEEENAEQRRVDNRKLETEVDLDVIKGSLFGGAMGDALGYPIEFLKRDAILKAYGDDGVSKYILNDNGLAEISDDTQMTLFTATGILIGFTRGNLRGIMGPIESYVWKAYGNWCEMQMGLNPDGYNRYSWLLDVPEMAASRAPGTTCVHTLMKQREGSVENPINSSKGCGGIMRIAPVALYLNREGDLIRSGQVFEVASEVAALTHGHELGWMASGAAAMIINLVAYAKKTIADATEYTITFIRENYSNRKHMHELVALMELALELSKNNKSDAANISELGEGWVAEETLAIAIYCSVKYQDDFSKAICVAVNHDGDSDSTGAVTGNILGAYMGYDKIPQQWKENLECFDVIEEIAIDLCHGCQMSEYSTYRDDEWEEKYIHMHRYSR